MLSLGQKLLAIGVIVLLNLAVLLVSPLFGILAIIGSAPLAFAILKK